MFGKVLLSIAILLAVCLVVIVAVDVLFGEKLCEKPDDYWGDEEEQFEHSDGDDQGISGGTGTEEVEEEE